MRRPQFVLVLALLLFHVFSTTHIEASVASRCRRYCVPAIDACTATGERRRRCKRQYVRLCRYSGYAACDLTPPTTTTTVPVTATTSTTITFTTTTTRPTYTTTSTTLPAFSVTGTWYLSASLLVNDCGLNVDYYVSSTLNLTQSGTSITGTMGTLSVSGSVDYADGTWKVFSAPSCDGSGCCVASGVEVDPLTNHATAALAIVGQCTSGLTCDVGYSGSIDRY